MQDIEHHVFHVMKDMKDISSCHGTTDKSNCYVEADQKCFQHMT